MRLFPTKGILKSLLKNKTVKYPKIKYPIQINEAYLENLFFITLNFGIALWLGDLIGKIHYGFFVVAGFYALIGLILYIFRNKWIKKPLNDSMINEMLN